MIRLLITISSLLILTPSVILADDGPTDGKSITTPDSSEKTEVSDDAETRINPNIGTPGTTSSVNAAKYTFLNLSANHIRMNGADWSGIVEKINSLPDSGLLSVVHIGDSHIQPDGNTGRVRKLLQADFGSAGRGLMSPYRLAGTNNPLDYKITSPSPLLTSTLMRMPWPTTMGFTGISVSPQTSNSQFTVKSSEEFDRLNIYASTSPDITSVTSDDEKIAYISKKTDYGCTIEFEKPVSCATVNLHAPDICVYGFDARRNNGGVLYHSIGNNGATFGSYSLIGNMGRHLNPLQPDLVILAMGTNEAFGRTTGAALKSSIDRLVKDIRSHNPQTQILLITPSECQRSVYTRRRKRRRRVRTYQVNTNVAKMRDAIIQYGAENNIAVYDFYQVAGGNGASAKWLQNKLLSRDRIHRTWAGYYLEGELLYSALVNALINEGLSEPPHSLHFEQETPPAKVSESIKQVNNKNYKKRTSKKKTKKSRRRR